MSQPLVSICVPIYNVEKHIEKCCRSLFEQTYKNIEFVFVNDCSPCNSVQIIRNTIKEYPNREKYVKIIEHEHNKGLSGARNTGVANSTGEYIMHVDSDDYLDLNVVECLANKSLEDNSDIVCYDMNYVFHNHSFIVSQSVSSQPKEFIGQLLTYVASVTLCGKMFRRTLFTNDDVRSVNGLNFGEDYATTPRIAYYAKRISHVTGSYYNYVQFNSNSYTNSYKSKNIDDLVLALKILEEFFNTKGEDYSKQIAIAKAINKTKLIIAICLHYDQVGNRLEEVCNLYSEVKADDYRSLDKASKVILWLASKGYQKTLKAFVTIGFRVKQIIKKKCTA